MDWIHQILGFAPFFFIGYYVSYKSHRIPLQLKGMLLALAAYILYQLHTVEQARYIEKTSGLVLMYAIIAGAFTQKLRLFEHLFHLFRASSKRPPKPTYTSESTYDPDDEDNTWNDTDYQQRDSYQRQTNENRRDNTDTYSDDYSDVGENNANYTHERQQWEAERARFKQEKQRWEEQKRRMEQELRASQEDLHQDPWDVLGISRSATKAEAKKAWLNLVKQYHPDRVQTLGKEFQDMAEKRMKAINAAFDYWK